MELEPRQSVIYGEGSKEFINIEGWTLKDKPNPDNPEDIRTIRANLAHHEWLEAKDQLFTPCVVMAWLHFLDLINSNPDYLWRYIYYRKAHERTHNLPTP